MQPENHHQTHHRPHPPFWRRLARAVTATTVKQSSGNNLCWAHMQELLGSLSNVLETLRGEGAPPPACRAVVHAALRYVDAELLNALMLRRDCCSISAVKALQVRRSHCHHGQLSSLSMLFDPCQHTISGSAVPQTLAREIPCQNMGQSPAHTLYNE